MFSDSSDTVRIANPCTPVRFRYSPPFIFKHLAFSYVVPLQGVYSCVYKFTELLRPIAACNLAKTAIDSLGETVA